MFHDSALYKFTIDINIDILTASSYVGGFSKNNKELTSSSIQILLADSHLAVIHTYMQSSHFK